MFNRKTVINILVFFIMLLCCCTEEPDTRDQFIKYESRSSDTDAKDLDQLFFVGKYGSRAGVYRYDFIDREYKIFWGTHKETVIKLSYNNNLENIFFLTAKRIGTNRGISSIRDVKLYRIDCKTLSSELISEIGDAVQLYSEWSSDNYNVQFTSFDLKYASLINKFNRIYSRFGKLLKEEKVSFNFITDRYPDFQITGHSTVSPSGNLGIIQKKDSLFINVAGGINKILVDSISGNVSKVSWSDKEDYLFLTIENKTVLAESTVLYIFDILEKSVVRKIVSGNRINFYVTKNRLIFDNKFNNQPVIEIINYRKNENVDRIKLWGGCGLKNISEF